ncbi:hypothetical protein [Nocardia sp. BSTN01]|uniref:hypothetical protein n=1 Tax=Nocardia sp. BSTN01 TaxID=2783665 RepID=UPI001E4D08DC|nr:hypothetical protein [Nocardia sp. BSTN01]
MTDRIAETEASVGERFPLYADPETGAWVSTRRGSWVAGFWVGQLWLRARLSDSGADRAAAEAAVSRLQPAAELDTVTRGLLFWYGSAAGTRLGISETGAALAQEAARQLAATFDTEAGILPWGTGFGDPSRPPVGRVDGLAGAVPLLAWAGESVIAERFLRTLLVRLRSSPRVIPAWEFSAGQWYPRSEPPPDWSRGAAWTALAAADAGYWIDPRFADMADEILSRTSHSNGVPTAATASGQVPDTSAAAITAVALCKLGRPAAAADLVETLIRDHLSGGDRPGRLLDGCYDGLRDLAPNHELIWGNFFLMLALAILEGEVSATAL